MLVFGILLLLLAIASIAVIGQAFTHFTFKMSTEEQEIINSELIEQHILT